MFKFASNRNSHFTYFYLKILVKNEVIFIDLLKLFNQHLDWSLWTKVKSVDDKLKRIAILIDFRQKEVDNFKKFLKDMEIISTFLVKIEVASFGKFFQKIAYYLPNYFVNTEANLFFQC